jgi:polysaccharide chain length determinant protein (PEP-CTERM system associated)
MTDIAEMRELDDEGQKGAGLERLQTIWGRRKWLALLVFAVPFVAATSIIFSLPLLYRSTATVLVDRQQVPEAFVRPTVTSELETRLQTISQEILSRSRLQSLVERFNLYPALRQRLSSEEIVERLRRDIQLELKATDSRRSAATIAFAISYKGLDAQTVAVVTNTLASFYIEENLKARERQATGTAEFLKTQISETEKRLTEQERRVSEFRKRYLGELPQQMQANLASLEALNTQLRLNNDNEVRAAERREALATQLVEAESLAQVPPPTPSAPAPGAEPPALHLVRLKQELTAAQTRYTDAHPTVTRLKDEIAAVERDSVSAPKPEPKPETEPAAPVAPPPNPYVLRLRDALHAAEAEVKLLKADSQRLRAAIGAYQARVENTPRREQEFQDISRDYDTTKEQHQSLVKRYGEAQLAESMEQRQKGEQFRLLDPAVPSAQPAAPNRPRLLSMVLVLSLGLAAGAVVLAEILDTSFHSAAELSALTAIPVLVRIAPIATEAEMSRRRLRLRLATAGALLTLLLIAGAAYFIAHNNEQLVRMLV